MVFTESGIKQFDKNIGMVEDGNTDKMDETYKTVFIYVELF